MKGPSSGSRLAFGSVYGTQIEVTDSGYGWRYTNNGLDSGFGITVICPNVQFGGTAGASIQRPMLWSHVPNLAVVS